MRVALRACSLKNSGIIDTDCKSGYKTRCRPGKVLPCSMYGDESKVQLQEVVEQCGLTSGLGLVAQIICQVAQVEEYSSQMKEYCTELIKIAPLARCGVIHNCVVIVLISLLFRHNY